MNIVVLVRFYPALSETFVRRQVQRLSATVLCESFKRDYYAELGLAGRVHEIGERPPLSTLAARVSARLSGGYADDWSRRQQRRARDVLRSEQPDAVLAHYGPNAIKVHPICKALGIRLFVHFHGYDASSLLRSPRYRSRIRNVLEDCEGVVVVSEAMAKTIAGLGTSLEKVSTIPCGVDVNSFGVASRNASGSCTFLAVGRLVEKKAPLLSVKAFELCADIHLNAYLRIVGFGPLLKALEAYVSSSRHRERIEILGPLQPSGVRSEMAAADVFVQHSVTASDGNTEGWPVSIAEAAASGLPIVSTRHAGIPMQVVDGVTGFLVDEGDYPAMGQAMQSLCENHELRLRMGKASREHIVENGSIDDSVSRLRALVTAE